MGAWTRGRRRAGRAHRARAVLASKNADAEFERFSRFLDAIRMGLYPQLGGAIKRGQISVDDANAALRHLVAVTARDAGIIDYRTNADASEVVETLGLPAHLSMATGSAAREFFDGSGGRLLDRGTAPLRPRATWERHLETLKALPRQSAFRGPMIEAAEAMIHQKAAQGDSPKAGPE